MERFRRLMAPAPLSGRAAVGLFALRFVTGVAFIFHGAPKMRHPTTWMLAGAHHHAVAPGWLQAVSALTEFEGGILLAVGFLTPLVAGLLFCNMSVALFAVELPSGAPFVGAGHTYELALLYLVTMFTFLTTGPGVISLDAWCAHSSWSRPRKMLTHSRA